MAKVPRFSNEREESEFWDSHDTTEYLDDTVPAEIEFADVRPTKTQISLRIDAETVNRVKVVARRKGIGYQTLIRVWVMERLEVETPRSGSR